MCGLIGIISHDSYNKIVDHLKLLQYRGYDSYGISIIDPNSKIQTHKKLGPVQDDESCLLGEIGIGHTRWATHGIVSLRNTHPLCKNNIAVAQNGIIKNFEQIKKRYPEYQFTSDTDTECILPMLLGVKFTIDKLQTILQKLEGSFAILILDASSQAIYFLVKGIQPLFVANNFIASDSRLLDSGEVFELQDGQVGIMTHNHLEIYPKVYKPIQINRNTQPHSKTKPTWFETEFFQQAKLLTDALHTKIVYPKIKPKIISITGCGSAHLAGQISRYWFHEIAKIDAHTYLPTEIPKENECIVGISQSGETYDLLYSLKHSNGYKISVLNNTNSSASKYSDFVIPAMAGEEISVASTKSTTCQMLALLKYACQLGDQSLDTEMQHMLKIMENLDLQSIENIAQKYYKYKHILILGKGILFPVACECALKIKELAYIHAEAIYTSELKHGPLALIDENVLVICLSQEEESVIHEIKSRNGKVELLKYDAISNLLSPFIYVFVCQWLAFNLAKLNGRNIDLPRNLAKSVTVE